MGANNCCSSRNETTDDGVIKAHMPEKGNQLSQMIKDENEAKRAQGAVGIPDKTIHSGFDAIVNN